MLKANSAAKDNAPPMPGSKSQRSKRAWFHPTVDGLEAEEVLAREGTEGSFLVRPSRSSPGDYAMSIKREEGFVHIQIVNHGDCYDIESGERFATLTQLVNYYKGHHGTLLDSQKQPIRLAEPVMCRRPTYERWFHDGAISSEDAESLLLTHGINGSFLVRASSSKPGDYVLSIRYCDKVAHTLINCLGDKFSAGPGKQFDSLTAVVDDIKANPMTDPFSGEVIQLKEFAKTRCRVAELPKILTAMDTARSSYTAFDGFEDEFHFVMSSEHREVSSGTGMQSANVKKNRYPNVVPYDQNRVKLPTRASGCFGGKPSDYINASYVKMDSQTYIATQAPLKNTMHDFWSMVWDQDSHIIVMLVKEAERGQERTAVYWPSKGMPLKIGNFMISETNEDVSIDIMEKSITVLNRSTNESREVVLFRFLAWPESGVVSFGSIDDVAARMLELNHRVQLAFNQKPAGPPIVHCSAGLGRTGVFMAISALAKLIDDKGKDADIDIAKLVIGLREQRAGMVQTPDQYRLLYSAVMVHAGLCETVVQSETSSEKKISYMKVSFQPKEGRAITDD